MKIGLDDNIKNEHIIQLFQELTQRLFNSQVQSYQEMLFRFLKTNNHTLKEQHLLNILKGVVDGLILAGVQIKANYQTSKLDLEKELSKMITKGVISTIIKEKKNILSIFEHFLGYIKDILKIITEHSFNQKLCNNKLIALIDCSIYKEFGEAFISAYNKANKKEENIYIPNPLQNLSNFISFYEDKELLITNLFIQKNNINNNNELENSIQSSDDSSFIYNFFWLIHFHPNPFIFRVLEKIAPENEQFTKLLQRLSSDFLGEENKRNNLEELQSNKHNSYYFVNIIKLLKLINTNKSNIKWNLNNSSPGEIPFIRLLYKYITKIQLLSLRYHCFCLGPMENDKKTIMEFFFDIFIFLNSKSFLDNNELESILIDLLSFEETKQKIEFENFFSRTSLIYLDNKLETLPKNAYNFLFFVKIMRIILLVQKNPIKNDTEFLRLSYFIHEKIKDNIDKQSYIFNEISIHQNPLLKIKTQINEWLKSKSELKEYSIFKEKISMLTEDIIKFPLFISSNFDLEEYKPKNLSGKNKEFIFVIDKGYPSSKTEKKECLKNNYSVTEKNNINDIDYYLLFPKRDLLLASFGLLFKKDYFNNDFFIAIKNYFVLHKNCNRGTKLIDFPSKIKNFSNGYEPHFFLSQNMKFLENQYFNITHRYVLKQLKEIPQIKKIVVKKTSFDLINTNNNSLECEIITRENVYRGKMYFNNVMLYFTTKNYSKSDIQENTIDFIMCSVTKEINDDIIKEIFIPIRDIKELIIKRFVYIEQAYEIFLSNGKSYFINFYSPKRAETFKKTICEYYNFSSKAQKYNIESPYINIIINCKAYVEKKKFHSFWKKEKISTYKYLCLLNKYSTRTFNDPNQYYIFPWIINNYNNFFEWDITDDSLSYRNLSLPPSVQSEDNQIKAKDKYDLCSYESEKSKPYSYHFGSHYSTSSFIYYYMMRMSPFIENLIKLQNYELEAADRMFTSINETRKIISNLFDNRELIPEFYSMMEFLINLNCCAFGRQSNNIIIDDWKLNDLWENKKEFGIIDYILFFTKNRFFLQYKARDNMNQWIDNIFGCNQLKRKREIINMFPKSTYEEMTKWPKKIQKYIKQYGDKNKDYLKNNETLPDKMVSKIQEKKNIVINFGQAPKQLFTSVTDCFHHNIPIISTKVKDDFSVFGDFRQRLMQNKKLTFNIVYFIKSIRQNENNYPLILFKNRIISIKDNTSNSNDNQFIDIIQLPHLKFFKDKKTNKFRYCPKYSICVIHNGSLIISCRYTDNSFMFHLLAFDKKNHIIKENIKVTKIYCETFVNAVTNIDDDYFLTGLSNGKLIKWQCLNITQTILIKSIFAHEKAITVIEYYKRLNIIITGGEDHYVYLRKEETFELLTVIKMESFHIPYLIKISDLNLVYVMTYCLKQTKYVYMIDYDRQLPEKEIHHTHDIKKCIEMNESNEKEVAESKGCKPKPFLFHEDIEKEYEKKCEANPNRGKYMITGFTLTGMKFANTNNMDISSFDILKSGDLLIGFYSKATIEVYIGHTLTVSKKDKIKIYSENNAVNITWLEHPVKYEDYSCLYSTNNGMFFGITINRSPQYKLFFPEMKDVKKTNEEHLKNAINLLEGGIDI